MTNIFERIIAVAFAAAVMMVGVAPTIAAPLLAQASAITAKATTGPTRVRWCPGSFPLIDGDHCPAVYYDPYGYREPSILDKVDGPVYGYRRVDGYYPRVEADYPRYRQPPRQYPVYK